jgi:hypothetical protein
MEVSFECTELTAMAVKVCCFLVSWLDGKTHNFSPYNLACYECYIRPRLRPVVDPRDHEEEPLDPPPPPKLWNSLTSWMIISLSTSVLLQRVR